MCIRRCVNEDSAAHIKALLGLAEHFFLALTGHVRAQSTGIMEFGLSLVGKGRVYVDGVLVLDNGWATKQTRGQTFYGLGTIEEICEVEVVQDRVYEVRVEYTNHPIITDSKKAVNGTNGTHTVNKPDPANGGHGDGIKATELEAHAEDDDDDEDAAGGQPPLMMAALRLGGAMQVQPANAMDAAVKLVSETDAAILVCGTSLDWEAEAGDRAHYSLPGQTDELVRRVLEANPNTVIVNQSVSSIPLHYVLESMLNALFLVGLCRRYALGRSGNHPASSLVRR